jgi:hypothetical protein
MSYLIHNNCFSNINWVLCDGTGAPACFQDIHEKLADAPLK